MCIVIDTNTVCALLDRSNHNHPEFKPVLDWVLQGKGKFVYGGSTYASEVFQKIRRFNRLFAELVRCRKAIVLCCAEVDQEEARIKAAEPSPDFDDAHILAILDVSGCHLLCSSDSRADKFVKKRKLYARRTSPPKIYRKARYHRKLLVDDLIAACCQPDTVVGRAVRESLDACVLGQTTVA